MPRIHGANDVTPHLRPAVDADVPAITALIDASVRGLATGYYSAAQVDEALVHLFGVDSQLIRDGTYFVIEAEGAIIASGGWGQRSTLRGGDQAKRVADALLDPTVDPARIRAFYVAPAWARRGLARQLYAVCAHAAVAAGFRRLQLGATLSGVPLYESLGFHVVERVEFTMPSGLPLPLVVMERVIP